MNDHECVFVEEQEPNGRLILGPCLVCGVSAMDALAQLRDELAQIRSHKIRREPMRALHENAKAYSQANQALREVWEYDHSTTLEFLIKCGDIGPADPRYRYHRPRGFPWRAQRASA